MKVGRLSSKIALQINYEKPLKSMSTKLMKGVHRSRDVSKSPHILSDEESFSI